MKEKLLDKLGLKIVSLILAFVVWMGIVNVSNPVKESSVTVPVEVRNGEVMKANNLAYEISSKSSVTVYFWVRTRDESLIRASDFSAYIDLEDLSVTGSVPVYVEVSKEKESLIVQSETKAITTKPMVMRVETEELQKKKFELSVTTNGKTEDGYIPGSTTLSPDYVIVEGPESQIGQIHHMGVEINVEGASSDIEGTTAPIFYDANSKSIPVSEDVTVNRDSIRYNTSILKAKALNLNFEVNGTVANGYRFTGVTSDVKSVSVVGTKSVLASVSTLSIADEKLNIDGATSDRVVQLDLNDYLPPSTTIAAGETSQVEVTLKVEPLITKIFSLDLENVEKQGIVPEYEYTYNRDKVDVSVRGLKEDLDTLTEESLNAVLDVTDLEPGTHTITLKFQVEEGFEIASTSDIEVTIASEETPESSEGEDMPAASPGETGTDDASKNSTEI